MKKIFITLTASFIALIGFSQTFQATIKAGPLPNSVIFAVKPSAAVTAAKITTLYFSVAVPASVLPKPTVNILTNFNPSISYTIETAAAPEMIGGILHHIYNFLGDGSTAAGVERNYTNTLDNNMVEVGFAGGPLPPATSNIRLVSLADGGLTSNTFFNLYNLGTDVTNTTAMFYGGTPVNSPSGYSGTSYSNLANVTLPTKFSHFLAIKKDDNAELTWTVETEENNAYFDVQRSLDGRLFTDVIRVNALRNGRSSNTYTTPDVNISRLGSKVLYYRIKQVETSGELVYSEVRQLNLDKKNFTIGLYPNPVISSTKLVVDAPEAGKAFIIIRDALGKTVQQINMEFVKGVNQKDLNASMLPAGEYNVTVMGEKFNQTIKMTKSN